ncbi:MAG TPA: acyltransferase [Polyangiales bacterium]|nr:acyltransferase [Polyangiales bacterium]
MPADQSLEDAPLIIPPNVRIGANSVLTGEKVFRRFFSERDPAIVIGEHCHLEGVQLALGKRATVSIGNYVYAAHLIALTEQEIQIGSYVFASFNVVIADTDFHPIDPAQRLLDAIAVSPLSGGRPRPPIATAPVIIEDDVWIGPNVTILKGVRIGAGAFIEPGSLVTRDVPPRARVLGNPAQVVGEV